MDVSFVEFVLAIAAPLISLNAASLVFTKVVNDW